MPWQEQVTNVIKYTLFPSRGLVLGSFAAFALPGTLQVLADLKLQPTLSCKNWDMPDGLKIAAKQEAPQQQYIALLLLLRSCLDWGL